MASKILLTISLLISNRPDTVRKCLDSIQPLLKAIPSELILTDTGCGEEVRGIIEEYTDHIIDFEWCKDFSKARNVGLKAAKGKWFLFLDDDEWFDDTKEIIDFFTSGEYKKYGYGIYVQRNYIDKDGSVYSDLPVARMIRLDPGVEFMYSIHECFNCIPGEVKSFEAFVHHYGYVYASPKEAKAHAMRNIELLLTEHKEHPLNMKHTLQLAQEYNSIKDWQKSIAISLEGIELAETKPVDLNFCVPSMYANVIENYIRLHKPDEAIEMGERYLKEKKLDPLASAMIAGLLAESYLQKGEMEKCMEKTVLYERIYQDYCKDEDAFLGYVTTITSDCFEPLNRSVVLGSGVRAAISAGRISKAKRWFNSIDMDGEKAFVSTEMIKAIIQRIAQADTTTQTESASKKVISQVALALSPEELAVLEEMCHTFLKRKELEPVVAKTILENSSTEKELKSFSGIKSELWVFALARLLGGEEPEKNALVVWRHMDESMTYLMKYHAMETLETAGCDIGKVLSQIPFYIWEKVLSGFVPDCKEAQAKWCQKWFSMLPASEDCKRLAWERLTLYRCILKAAEATGNTLAQGEKPKNNPDKGKATNNLAQGKAAQIQEETERLLWEYSSVTMALCEQIYKAEILEDSRDVLPAQYQVAFLLRDLRQAMEDDQLHASVELIRQIKELAPKLTEAMKPVLARLQKKTQEEAAKQQDMTNEMQILGIQIKMRIRQLMQAGQAKEALAVAGQLASMLPGDEELQGMIKELER